MMKRALFIGLNDYPGSPLEGCVSDATAMHEILAKNEDGSPNFQGILLTTAAEITRERLTKAITTLFAQPADVALLYFAGHGSLDKNLGGYLVTSDAKQYTMGIRMLDILHLANQAPIKEVFIILDCCHSGSFGASTAATADKVVLNEGRSVLTASRADESSIEEEETGHGLFTFNVLAALEGGAADVLGKVNAAGVYAYLDEVHGAWDQRPLFKANVSTLHALRQCHPQVTRESLRRLPKYFADAAGEFALDPSFEPTVEGHDADNAKIFGELQKMRAARLVEPVGHEHMYYAAMESKACRLTKLGRFYWRLACDGKI